MDQTEDLREPEVPAVLQRVLTKIRGDMTMELRVIRHSTAPSTKERRETLEHLFKKCLESQRILREAESELEAERKQQISTMQFEGAILDDNIISTEREPHEAESEQQGPSMQFEGAVHDDNIMSTEREHEASAEQVKDDDGINKLLEEHSRAIHHEVEAAAAQKTVRRVLASNFENNIFRATTAEAAPHRDASANRPSTVTNELASLSSRRRVAALLSAPMFRANLETMLDQMPARLPTRLPPRLPTRNQETFQASPRPRVSASQSPAAFESGSSETDPTSAMPRRARAPATTDYSNPPPTYTPTHTHMLYPEPETTSSDTRDDLYSVPSRRERLIEPHVPWPQSTDPLEIHRQMVEDDLENLVHERIVSHILSGEFRPVLEFHLQERAGRRGGGSRTEAAPRPAPPPPRQATRLLEEHSAAPPRNRSQLRMEDRIEDLAHQLNEMARVLRLSFDLQLDVQRSIRQEVAAALCQRQAAAEVTVEAPTAAGGATGSTRGPLMARPVGAGNCLICLDHASDTLMYKCGHLCTCYLCARDLKSRGHHCPMCRAPIEDIVRVYAV